MSERCVFCDILEGRAPAYIVGENELAFALLDIQPLSEGHCLVLPRRHVERWDQMTVDETDAVFRLARETAEKIRRVYQPDCVTMLARGRRVPHAHIFVVPTFKDDGLDRVFDVLEVLQEHASPLLGLRGPEQMRLACERLRDA